MRFDGKIAVVTGAATGMGAATARLFAAEGAQLVLGDVNESGGLAIAEELRGVFMRTDVGVRDEVEALIKTAVVRHGRIDILFNNAGIGHYGKTPATSAEAWERVIAVDLNATFYACHAAIPHMPKPGGAIINNASISGLGGDHGMSAYNAAKGALVNYTRSLAVDHAAEGIRVNAICPGYIETPLAAAIAAMPKLQQAWVSAIPMGRPGRAEEIAKVVAFLASDEASYITGVALPVDGGVTAWTGQPDAGRFIEGLKLN
jgi:meso-butanediol dehydrogenase/(S,S)-butanediol dehydrogenase/diacetyl reductase